MGTESLDGKAIIVTGGSSGLGRATAIALARAGARVMVADVNKEGAAETLALIAKAGGATAQFVPANVTSESDVKAMVEATLKAYGRLDGAFNNAGLPQHLLPLHEISSDQWRRVIDLNLTGVFLCLKYEITAMLKAGSGSIVNTCSTAGVTAMRAMAEYCASKHGVVGLTKAAAMDYTAKGIRINAICPGFIDTGIKVDAPEEEIIRAKKLGASLIPLGRFAAPNEIANAAVWLLSDEASYVNGTCMTIDGGLSMGPYISDSR
jgi:NAD(P)-dependent dehydrogenase (short-subunit alcohol dehydrogenase family)